jgi:hypothetical protein
MASLIVDAQGVLEFVVANIVIDLHTNLYTVK